jgi:PAS domain-containing protein
LGGAPVPAVRSAVAVFVISFITLWGHLHGQGPFIRPTVHESLFLVQSFIAVTAITSLVMAAVVAERKRARDELHALFENTQEAILIADAESRYVDANPAACALTGYTREELMRLRSKDITPSLRRIRGSGSGGSSSAPGRWKGSTTSAAATADASRSNSARWPTSCPASICR